MKTTPRQRRLGSKIETTYGTFHDPCKIEGGGGVKFQSKFHNFSLYDQTSGILLTPRRYYNLGEKNIRENIQARRHTSGVLDNRVYKEQKLCMRWRRCDRSQVSAGPGLAALYTTVVTALAARICNRSVQTASLQCFSALSKGCILCLRSDYRKQVTSLRSFCTALKFPFDCACFQRGEARANKCLCESGIIIRRRTV